MLMALLLLSTGMQVSLGAPPFNNKQSEGQAATKISAQRLYGRQQQLLHAEGNAKLRKGNLLIEADEMRYWPLDDRAEAKGNVRLVQPGHTTSAPVVVFHPDEQSGEIKSASYEIANDEKSAAAKNSRFQKTTDAFELPPLNQGQLSARGKAEHIEVHDYDHSILKNATYTTCRPNDLDWYAKAETLTFDHKLHIGKGNNAAIYFKDIPILYTPLLLFPLKDGRVSGFLTPSWGTSTRSGLELLQPYYWNIAPNYDATITARFLAKRGLQLNNEGRYKGRNYSGIINYDFLDDSAYNNVRQRYAWQHTHNLGLGLSGKVSVAEVSDHQYFSDLSHTLASASQTQIPKRYQLFYNPASWWRADATIQHYQTLQPDPEVTVSKPYFLEPRINFNGGQADFFGFTLNINGQYTHFKHPTRIQGQRLYFYPQLTWEIEEPYFYLRPKIGVHLSQYELNQRNKASLSVPKFQRREVPIFSVDSGVFLERPVNYFGREFTHTLEPRLFYVNIPHYDQSKLPVFDTGRIDFNFAQLFTENRYSGSDRIGDADHITASLSSKLIDNKNGARRVNATIAQRYYFRTPRAGLPGETFPTKDSSDILASFSGSIIPRTYIDMAIRYDQQEQITRRSSFGVRFQPEHGKAVSVTYRAQHNQLQHIDFKAQWPIFHGLYGVGRYNYALKDRRYRDKQNRPVTSGKLIEALLGLEYREYCWATRLVTHRIESVGGKTAETYFVQLELNDFATIGFNPLSLLSRSVPGYTRITNLPYPDDDHSDATEDSQ